MYKYSYGKKKSLYDYKHYGIYQTTNLLNGMIYIGQHRTNNLNDDYLGSNFHLMNSINEHGKENFKREWLFLFDNNDEMCQKEIELVTEEFVSRKDTYNLTVGGQGGPHFKGRSHSEETKNRIRTSNTGKTHSEETKLKLRRPRKPMSEETKAKLSAILKGRSRKVIAE